MFRALSTTLAVGVCLFAQTAGGQSINIDFGSGNGSPDDDYAAQGLAGHWNTIDMPFNPDIWPPVIPDPIPLKDIDGNPTRASLVIHHGNEIGPAGTFTDIPLPHPELGIHQPLMGDSMLGCCGPDITLNYEFHGLEDGLYRIITYTWYWPADLFTMDVITPGPGHFFDGTGLLHPAGGPWPGDLALGITHMAHTVQVTDGTIAFETLGGGMGAFFNGDNLVNGIQLWKIEPASAACAPDFDQSGAVGFADLLLLLAAWGTPGGNLNDDGSTGFADLLILLAAWGPCPIAKEVDCGRAGAGSCYIAHDGPSCDDDECCTKICAIDPYCCDNEWDAICAGLANLPLLGCADALHPNCGSPGTGPCDASGPDATQGCSDPECCQTVCAIDPFCCIYGWDTICVEEAKALCSE